MLQDFVNNFGNFGNLRGLFDTSMSVAAEEEGQPGHLPQQNSGEGRLAFRQEMCEMEVIAHECM